MLSLAYGEVIRTLADVLCDEDVAWALTGSTSFALQGMNVEPKDIDVQSDEKGVRRIEALLKNQITHPVTFVQSERIQSYLGALSIDGVTVELMGALQKRGEDGAWEQPVDVARLRIFVPFQSRSVPVLPLEHEYRAYLRLGRLESAELIREFIAARGVG